MLISILLVNPPAIVTVADNTADDSKPLNADDVNATTTTMEKDINNNNYY